MPPKHRPDSARTGGARQGRGQQAAAEPPSSSFEDVEEDIGSLPSASARAGAAPGAGAKRRHADHLMVPAAPEPSPSGGGGGAGRKSRLNRSVVAKGGGGHIASALGAGEGTQVFDEYESVVKVFAIHCEPNFSLPWQRKRQFSSSSTGFMIQGRRILTNAHCVADHTQVKVKRRGSDVKYVAQVLAVATEGDMALLTVDDEAFWVDSEPVVFGELPQLQDGVSVVGYPIGGDTMSVTSGVVSRIEVTSYVHGAAELLGIQIDAAINSGNSGGPAFNDDGHCVGIAFQSLKHEDAENIGYIIPTPVVQHFIHDYEKNGKYTGFPCLGIEWQKLENPDLRATLKMKPTHKGVMIRRIEPTTDAFKVLAQNDVLLSFDGVPIANDGTVPFRSGERIGFSYLVSQKYSNEFATLRVLKQGVEHTLMAQLQAPTRLVPFHIKGEPPSYFIVAGLVFTPITVPYLKSEYGKEFDFDAPVRLLDKMVHVMADTVDQQVVVLSQVLAADINIGYEEIINTQVLKLNGEKVNNLGDLVRMVDHCKEEFLQLDLDYNQKVVLSTSRAKQATKEILVQHCIATDRSSDLLPGSATAGAALPEASKGGKHGAAAAAAATQDASAEEHKPEAKRGRKAR